MLPRAGNKVPGGYRPTGLGFAPVLGPNSGTDTHNGTLSECSPYQAEPGVGLPTPISARRQLLTIRGVFAQLSHGKKHGPAHKPSCVANKADELIIWQ